MIRALVVAGLTCFPGASTLASPPQTRFAPSRDGTRIAYDVSGSGPAIMLLHGGGQTRKVWHDAGYVDRLAHEFTVITVDLRGNGESDKPVAPEAYAIDKVTDDLLAVADAAGAPRFILWGFSYGANVGRYLAARSDRVAAMVYIGIPFGAAADGQFRDMIVSMRDKWTPIIAADRAAKLDLRSLSDADRVAWQRGTVPVSIAWLSAMLAYPPIEPGDVRAPTLWVVGKENRVALESTQTYRDKLAGSPVTLFLVDGLNHPQELDAIDRVYPRELEFSQLHKP